MRSPPAGQTTSPTEAAATLAAILATIPAGDLKLYGIEKSGTQLRLKNYFTRESIRIATAADLDALQPAATAALATMAEARARAAKTLRAETLRKEASYAKKPTRRGPQMDSPHNRDTHQTKRKQPSRLSASRRH